MLLYIYINCRAFDARPWLKAQKRDRLKRRREISLAEGNVRKKLRIELLESLTMPIAEAPAPWNMTTDAAIERQSTLASQPEQIQSYLNDDDDNTLQGHLPLPRSTSILSSYPSSTPLLPSTPPPLSYSYSQLSTQGEPSRLSYSQISTQGELVYLTPLRELPQLVNLRELPQFKQSYSQASQLYAGGFTYTQANLDVDDIEKQKPL
jgi:hypothetical protein